MTNTNKIQETSLLAYEEVKENLGEKQLTVLNALKKIQPATNSMIAKYLNLPINTITPRMHELRNQKKRVTYTYSDICPVTKRKAMFWKCVDTLIIFDEGSEN